MVLLFGIPLLGPSAATPPLGRRTPLPSYDLGLHPGVLVVSIALVLGYGLGAAAVWSGLRGVQAGWVPRPRQVALCAVALALIALLVAPFGSGDHLSYAAYGRIADLGGDPYAIAPGHWSGSDQVIAATELPWRNTPDVYGPVATAMFTVVSAVGHGSLRTTVWLWQVLMVAAFLLLSLMLHRLAGGDRRLQARVAVLWTLNPVLAAVVLGGAHLDLISTAAAIAGIWLALASGAGPVRWILAGAALGVAAGTKLPYAVAGLAVLWAVRRRGWRTLSIMAVAGLTGAAAVLVPAHLWAGRHAYDQAHVASRYVSIASPWRIVVSGLEAVFGPTARSALPFAFAVLAVAVVLAAGRWLRPAGSLPAHSPEAGPALTAVRALLVLSLAYPVAAPYVLPWYDAPLWASLALIAVPMQLTGLLLLRLTALAVSYVPGRGDVPAGATTDVLMGVRHSLAPVVTAVLLGVILNSRLRRKTSPSPATATPRATIAALPKKPGVP
jgi:hypothetical protein